MMKQLGISVYPESASLRHWEEYIVKASEYGFTRIFSNLLEPQGDKQQIIGKFKPLFQLAKEKEMETILDVAPSVFKKLEISYDDLGFFHELGVDGIRLDEGFDGIKEAQMTYNQYNLKIELNASILDGNLSNIVSHKPKISNLITCHNFYPQRYTGLSLGLFERCTKAMKDSGLIVSAFISSNQPDAFGPWPVKEGLCTIENHRDLPLDLQARHLIALGNVDAIIIANAFASDEELRMLGDLDLDLLTFRITLEKPLTQTEREILYDFPHTVRPDMSDYMARSTMPRIAYADQSIPADNTRDLKRGDIVILNDEYGRYKGELHVVLKAMPNTGNKNVLGHLDDQELFLLDYLEPFRSFQIK